MPGLPGPRRHTLEAHLQAVPRAILKRSLMPGLPRLPLTCLRRGEPRLLNLTLSAAQMFWRWFLLSLSSAELSLSTSVSTRSRCRAALLETKRGEQIKRVEERRRNGEREINKGWEGSAAKAVRSASVHVCTALLWPSMSLKL